MKASTYLDWLLFAAEETSNTMGKHQERRIRQYYRIEEGFRKRLIALEAKAALYDGQADCQCGAPTVDGECIMDDCNCTERED